MPVGKSLRLGTSVLFASAMGFVALTGLSGRAGVVRLADNSQGCPAPAVEQTATSETPVTKANYAFAETEVILGSRIA